MTHARTIVSCTLAAFFIGLSGCAKTTIRGRVISSEIGRAIVVAETDERMDEPGIADVEVTISQGGILGQAETTSKGDFSFSIQDAALRSGPVLVRVEGDPVFRVQNQVQIPHPGQAILVNAVKRTPSEDQP